MCIRDRAEDEQERFDRMQQALLMANPESVAFYNAQMRTQRRVCASVYIIRPHRHARP